MIQKIGTLSNYGGPILVDRIIKNSVAMAVGHSVKTDVGFAAIGTTGARVLGQVESLIGSDGLTPVKDGTYLGNIGEEYTVEADNQTDKKVRVRVDIDQMSLYSAELDAAAGTTTGSNLAGYNFDIVDKDTLDESTAIQTTAQFYSHGIDRNDTAKVVVNILESEVFGF